MSQPSDESAAASADAAGAEPAVLVRVEGHLGRITLNRPDTLNALTLEMVRLIDAAFDRFEADDAVQNLVIDAVGERALCAGGDIRSLYESAIVGDTDGPSTFWDEEYHLDSRLHAFPKPVVAIMDGIVMGGGVGISAHARHRIVTERSAVAMPEVGIGFCPDVGGNFILSRAPGELGTHAALTGARLGAADAILVGLADVFVPAGKLDELRSRLATTDAESAIAAVAAEPPEGRLPAARDWIDRCYSSDDVVEVHRRLVAEGGDAAKAAAELDGKSPTSLHVALRALRTARTLASLERCLEMEFRISMTFIGTHDFVEGVRAAVIDKDRSPRFDPPSIDVVPAASIEPFFTAGVWDLRLDPVGSER